MKKTNIILLLLIFTNILLAQDSGLYKFLDENGKYGFMDKTGKIKIKPQFRYVDEFNEGLCFVERNTGERGYKWSCIDTLGTVVFDANDQIKTGFNEGFAVLGGAKGHYFVNRNGQRAFDNYFQDSRGNFSNGFAVVSEEKFTNFRIIDTTGNYVEYLPFINPTIIDNGLSTFHVKNKGITIFNTNGKILIDSIQEITDLSNEYILLKRNGKWGFINKKGEIVIDFIYGVEKVHQFDVPLVGYFNEGLAPFKKDGLWGFINTRNEVVIEPKYKKVNNFSEGLAGVSVNGKEWGFIDKSGHYLIEPKFYLTDVFKNGICAVQLNYQGEFRSIDYYMDGIIDTTGKVILEQEMYCYAGFNGDLIKYYGGGHFTGGVHYIDKTGKKIEPTE